MKQKHEIISVETSDYVVTFNNATIEIFDDTKDILDVSIRSKTSSASFSLRNDKNMVVFPNSISGKSESGENVRFVFDMY